MPQKLNVVDLPALVSVVRTDKLIVVDVSDTTEGPLGSVKVAELDDIGAVFQQELDAAALSANNALSSANAAAGSAAAAAAIVNISSVTTFTNPLAHAIAVQMTASATVGGIQQLDNDNLDMGTNDFTLHWEGALPDWTPAATVSLQLKFGSSLGLGLQVLAAGTIQLLFGVGSTETYVSTVATGISDNASAKITCVVIRETASAAGSVTFYVNGVQLGSSRVITARSTPTINNTLAMYAMGSNAVRTAGSLQASRLFNRALTAAEVLDLSINGVALADRGAANTPALASDFSAGVDSYLALASVTLAGNIDSIFGENDTLRVTVSTTGSSRRFGRSTGVAVVAGEVWDLSFKIAVPAANDVLDAVGVRLQTTSGSPFTHPDIGLDGPRAVASTPDTWVSVEYKNMVAVSSFNTSALLWVVGSAGNTVVASVTIGDILYIKDIKWTKKGLTSELLASNAQSNTGQILDSSGNKNHALLPASGATIVGRPVSQTREVRWTNTWAGTNELQYIGGVNQAILPANAYIESIIGTVSGATPHDIIVGDGSDTDRYVTITTGLAAGTTSFTLANRTTDGTNLKLTVDPDTNADMSIAWVIRYAVLES